MPGQNIKLAFTAGDGQKITLNVTNNTFPDYTYVSVVHPDGTGMHVAALDQGVPLFVDQLTLPVAGEYYLLIDPIGAHTGTVTLRMNALADVDGTLVIGGGPVTRTTAIPGQNIRLTFEGISGQQISLSAGASPFL